MRLRLADAAELLARARRTRFLRIGLAAAAAALLAAAVVVALRHDPGEPPLAEPGRTTVLVLDVSSSIDPAQYGRIASTLDRAVAEGGRVGAVLFSDVAYELLPPGTPVAELAGLRRFFVPLPAAAGGAEAVEIGATRFPKPPWGEVFSSGTRISTGLRLAAGMLAREGVSNGKVVLISDLDDEYEDLPVLGRVLADYAEAQLPLRIVGLASRAEDEQIFRRLVGRASVERAETTAAEPDEPSAGRPEPFPVALAGLGIALVLALALNEQLLARLPLRAGEGGG
jgi:hypothetical protein